MVKLVKLVKLVKYLKYNLNYTIYTMRLRSGFSYSYKDLTKKRKMKNTSNANVVEEQEICCICYKTYRKNGPRQFKKISCSMKNYNLKYHHYHIGCLVKYVNESGHNRCPYCRGPLFTT